MSSNEMCRLGLKALQIRSVAVCDRYRSGRVHLRYSKWVTSGLSSCQIPDVIDIATEMQVTGTSRLVSCSCCLGLSFKSGPMPGYSDTHHPQVLTLLKNPVTVYSDSR